MKSVWSTESFLNNLAVYSNMRIQRKLFERLSLIRSKRHLDNLLNFDIIQVYYKYFKIISQCSYYF